MINETGQDSESLDEKTSSHFICIPSSCVGSGHRHGSWVPLDGTRVVAMDVDSEPFSLRKQALVHLIKEKRIAIVSLCVCVYYLLQSSCQDIDLEAIDSASNVLSLFKAQQTLHSESQGWWRDDLEFSYMGLAMPDASAISQIVRGMSMRSRKPVRTPIGGYVALCLLSQRLKIKERCRNDSAVKIVSSQKSCRHNLRKGIHCLSGVAASRLPVNLSVEVWWPTAADGLGIYTCPFFL